MSVAFIAQPLHSTYPCIIPASQHLMATCYTCGPTRSVLICVDPPCPISNRQSTANGYCTTASHSPRSQSPKRPCFPLFLRVDVPRRGGHALPRVGANHQLELSSISSPTDKESVLKHPSNLINSQSGPEGNAARPYDDIAITEL